MIAWVYGSGFPKSHDVSKAIDKAAGAEGAFGDYKSANHEIKRKPPAGLMTKGWARPSMADETIVDRNARQYLPATDAARHWQGWGTALKPALEPITVARKPLIGTVAQNVLAHGTGALNIEACRVGAPDGVPLFSKENRRPGSSFDVGSKRKGEISTQGRWPANLIHDGSDEVTALFPQAGGGFGVRGDGPTNGRTSYALAGQGQSVGYGDSGSAARFFYTAKAAKSDRDDGLDGMRVFRASEITGRGEGTAGLVMAGGKANPFAGTSGEVRRNHHPTVKPVDLMQYLCRLVTPPGGIVLDPFMGSGSTGRAAVMEGFRFIGIERDPEYAEIARARIANSHGPLFGSQSHD